MGSIVSKLHRRMPPYRLRDLTRTALLLRRLSETEMLCRGIAWIEAATRLASLNSLEVVLSKREVNE
ncbi:MAG: hypothetical protein ACFFCH_08920 [Promethearchaeota archaeon]